MGDEHTPWKVRRIRVAPGRHGWVVADLSRRDAIPLPRGLVDGTCVLVLSVNREWAQVRNGRWSFELHAERHLDMGRNFLIDGKWVREDDPRVLDAWQHTLLQLRHQPAQPGPPDNSRRDAVHCLEILLARHGRRL